MRHRLLDFTDRLECPFQRGGYLTLLLLNEGELGDRVRQLIQRGLNLAYVFVQRVKFHGKYIFTHFKFRSL